MKNNAEHPQSQFLEGLHMWCSIHDRSARRYGMSLLRSALMRIAMRLEMEIQSYLDTSAEVNFHFISSSVL